MLTAYYVIIAAAIVAMLVGLYLIFDLKKVAKGGVIGRVVNLLYLLVLIFILGYAITPVMPRLPLEVNLLLVASVYLFGAIFVVTVLNLIKKLTLQVMNELKS